MRLRDHFPKSLIRGASRLAMTLLTAGCAVGTAFDPQSAQADTLAALGASDVVGIGARHPDREGWVPILATLMSPGTRVIKVGVSGWQAHQVLDRGLPEVLRARPDTVVLWVGVNDFLAQKPLSRFRAELAAILDELDPTRTRVVVLNLPDLDRLPAFQAEGPRMRRELLEWQQAVKEECGRQGALVIDLAAFSAEVDAHPEYLSADGFHPSAHGYRRLAEIIFVILASP